MKDNFGQFEPFHGNNNLKRRDQPVEWTADLVEEWMKCSNDPLYFIEQYIKLIHVDHGLVSMKLYEYQKEIILSLHHNRNTIVATSRQSGKTSSLVAYLTWYVLFNPDKTVAILANKAETAREILGRIRLAYQHLPRWIQQGVVEWNKGSIVFENNSRILADATSSDAIRGYSVNFLFIDEASHIDLWDEFYTSVVPTISSGKTTKLCLVSTPNGLNHFWKIWSNAQQKLNDFNPIEVSWEQVPGRDQAWKDKTLADLNFDEEKFGQEYSVQWLGSSGTLIAGWKLKQLFHDRPLRLPENGFYQYVLPQKDRAYAIVADVSRGKGLDYSAFHVIDITEMPYQQVATFRDNLTLTTDYAGIIHNVAILYNNALVLVETNDLGEEVCNILHNEFEYENIIQTESNGSKGKRIATGHSGKQSDRGIRTTLPVKNKGCSILKMLIEQNQLILKDENTIDELKTFSRKNKTYEAEPGNNDDLAMGLVLFAWMSDQNVFKELTDIDTLSKLREKTEEQLMNDLVPFGFKMNNGMDEDVEPLFIESPDYSVHYPFIEDL